MFQAINIFYNRRSIALRVREKVRKLRTHFSCHFLLRRLSSFFFFLFKYLLVWENEAGFDWDFRFFSRSALILTNSRNRRLSIQMLEHPTFLLWARVTFGRFRDAGSRLPLDPKNGAGKGAGCDDPLTLFSINGGAYRGSKRPGREAQRRLSCWICRGP